MRLSNAQAMLVFLFITVVSACGGGSSNTVEPPPPVTAPDSDNDGVPDSLDAFPDNPDESQDSDNDGVGDNADAFPEDPNRWEEGSNQTVVEALEDHESCNTPSQGINWDALSQHNCSHLSDYNLFASSGNPTSGLNGRGFVYHLSHYQFVDYARQHRFIFLPEETTMTFQESDVFEFPVGAVIVKTMSLPVSTDTNIEDSDELLLETQLLIHRESGWVALPYYWQSQEDALLVLNGVNILDVFVEHKDTELTFDYRISDINSCQNCHGSYADESVPLKPLGIKQRFLTTEGLDEYGLQEAISFMTYNGYLDSVPEIDYARRGPFPFLDDLDYASPAFIWQDVMHAAQGYLDQNCSHCHQIDGPAYRAGSRLDLRYEGRNYVASSRKYGICEAPAGNIELDYLYNIVPGQPEESYLRYMMTAPDWHHPQSGIARANVHLEAVALMEAWINLLPYLSQVNCGD